MRDLSHRSPRIEIERLNVAVGEENSCETLRIPGAQVRSRAPGKTTSYLFCNMGFKDSIALAVKSMYS